MVHAGVKLANSGVKHQECVSPLKMAYSVYGPEGVIPSHPACLELLGVIACQLRISNGEI